MNRASRQFAVAILLAISAFVFPPSARAWGCKGHQTVALIAERHLTPEARQMVDAILKANPIDPTLKRWCGNSTNDLMVDASTWPDDVRNQRKNGSWHYIDIPRDAKPDPAHPGAAGLAGYCGPESCVTEAIKAQLTILEDKTADPAKRADALRYIIHFVGDLHQPMHGVDNNDHGGNCVPVQYLRVTPVLSTFRPQNHDYSPNLHNIWDTAIVERDMEVGDPWRYAGDLDAAFAAQIPVWEKTGIQIDDWAWESHDLANRVAYGAFSAAIEPEAPVKMKTCADDNDIAGRMLKKNLVANEAYQAAAAPVMRERIEQAGVRLAMILNAAAAAKPAP
jgi:hypothetical protein